MRISDQSPLAADLIDVSLQVRTPVEFDVELPKLDALPRELQPSGLRRLGPTTDADGHRLWELTFKLDPLAAGQFELPALEVRYRALGETDWTVARTVAIPIDIRSLLGDDAESAQPKPNPGPATIPGSLTPWIIFVAILMALSVVASLAAFFFSRRTKHSVVPAPESPYRKAMDAIYQIELAGWLERGEVDRFYTELSGVVRHYIEERFGLRAPEQTTEEFLSELTQRPVLSVAQRSALMQFLEQCDLVKFARARPTQQEGQAALKAARSFVEATRADEAGLTTPQSQRVATSMELGS